MKLNNCFCWGNSKCFSLCALLTRALRLPEINNHFTLCSSQSINMRGSSMEVKNVSWALRSYQQQVRKIQNCLVKWENDLSSCIVRTWNIFKELVSVYVQEFALLCASLIPSPVKPCLSLRSVWYFYSNGGWVIDTKIYCYYHWHLTENRR